MSQQAILQLSKEISQSEEIRQKIRAITTYRELVKFGEIHGYYFTAEDIAKASAAYNQESDHEVAVDNAIPSSDKNLYPMLHYDFKCSDIPKFADIAPEFEKIKIKPSTVDLNHFERFFKNEDFNFTSISPAALEFPSRAEEIVKSDMSLKELEPNPEYTKRSFHLINLDLHVEHNLYEDYFLRKYKIIKFLENIFETEVRFSGSLWYPQKAYRLWHTNETQSGWRMYWIDFDGFESNNSEKSFFRYMNPQTKELVTLYEQPQIVRFFRVESDADKLFWHCIANPTKFNRWSFGFSIPDNWMEKLLPGVKLERRFSNHGSS
jgi:hypothetical protein